MDQETSLKYQTNIMHPEKWSNPFLYLDVSQGLYKPVRQLDKWKGEDQRLCMDVSCIHKNWRKTLQKDHCFIWFPTKHHLVFRTLAIRISNMGGRLLGDLKVSFQQKNLFRGTWSCQRDERIPRGDGFLKVHNFLHLSNEEKHGCLGYISGIILHCYEAGYNKPL